MAKISDYGATAGADPNYIPESRGGFTAVPTVNSVDDIIVAHANLLIDHNFQLQRALMEPTRQLNEIRQKNIDLEIENRAWRTQVQEHQKQYESLNEDYRSDRQRLNEELASERAHVQKLKSEVENLTNQMQLMVDPLSYHPSHAEAQAMIDKLKAEIEQLTGKMRPQNEGVGGTPKTETRAMHIDGSKIIAQGRAAHEQHIAATQQPERDEP